MTREDIIKAMGESGVGTMLLGVQHDKAVERLTRFAALVSTAEREACAKVCDSLEEQCEKLGLPDEKWPTPADCAFVIRSKGEIK
jgi:hypothetical protein